MWGIDGVIFLEWITQNLTKFYIIVYIEKALNTHILGIGCFVV